MALAEPVHALRAEKDRRAVEGVGYPGQNIRPAFGLEGGVVYLGNQGLMVSIMLSPAAAPLNRGLIAILA